MRQQLGGGWWGCLNEGWKSNKQKIRLSRNRNGDAKCHDVIFCWTQHGSWDHHGRTSSSSASHSFSHWIPPQTATIVKKQWRREVPLRVCACGIGIRSLVCTKILFSGHRPGGEAAKPDNIRIRHGCLVQWWTEAQKVDGGHHPSRL